MKCRKLIFAIISLFSLQLAKAESTKTVFNPYTGKFDFITALTTSSIVAGTGIVVSTNSKGVNISASGSAASSLAVNQNGVQISSPTGAINALSPPFIVTQVGGTTAQFTLDFTSITAQGLITAASLGVLTTSSATATYIQNRTTLQSGATFYTSSGTVNNFNVGSGGILSTGGNFRVSNGSQDFPSFSNSFPSISLNASGTSAGGFGITGASAGAMMVQEAGCIGPDYQGFAGNASRCGEDLWVLPNGDAAGVWKSDGSHNLSIATLSASDMSALLSSTNSWTAKQTFPQIVVTSSITVSSNTILPGATFYQNGTLQMASSATVGQLTISNTNNGTQCLQSIAGAVSGTGVACGSGGGGSGIVSPGTFTWTNNFGYSGSTLSLVNATGPTSLVVSTAGTGISQLAVSSAIAVLATDPIFSISSAAATTILWVNNAGNLVSSGTTTTVTSCGTSPSVAGNNIAGQITVGGGVVTACTLNFANGGFINPPICIPSDNSATVSVSNGATSATQAVFNLSATLGGGLINYVCFGFQK